MLRARYLTGEVLMQQKSDRLIQLQAQALSVLAGIGDDERDLEAAASAVGRLQLPTGSRLCTSPERPGAACLSASVSVSMSACLPACLTLSLPPSQIFPAAPLSHTHTHSLSLSLSLSLT